MFKRPSILVGAMTLAACTSMASLSPAATIAYWQFDAEGVSDYLKASVGGSTYDLVNVAGGQSASAVPALGQKTVPNPDTTPGFTGTPTNNTGSLFSQESAPGAYVETTGDGSAAIDLDGTSRWTLEGFAQANSLNESDFDILFTTRAGPNTYGAGIIFNIEGSGSSQKFKLYVQDGSSNSASTTFGTGIFADADSVNFNWHHFAVTFDSTKGTPGNGQFEVFFDGDSLGAWDLPATVARTSVDGNDVDKLRIGGRNDGSNTFDGRFDEWRISDTVLEPSQFLIPEPSAAILLLTGGLLLAIARRR